MRSLLAKWRYTHSLPHLIMDGLRLRTSHHEKKGSGSFSMLPLSFSFSVLGWGKKERHITLLDTLPCGPGQLARECGICGEQRENQRGRESRRNGERRRRHGWPRFSELLFWQPRGGCFSADQGAAYPLDFRDYLITRPRSTPFNNFARTYSDHPSTRNESGRGGMCFTASIHFQDFENDRWIVLLLLIL